jgi:hypothetical protein
MRTRHLLRLLAVPMLVLSLGLAGCGGGRDNGGSGKVDPAVAQHQQQLKFAKCMREQGLDYPDPQPAVDGQAGAAGATKVDDPVKFEAALSACRKFLPEGDQVKPASPEDLAKLRAFAKCMRDKGLDFPDPPVPAADGTVPMQVLPTVPAQDQQKFADAMKACQK